MLGIEMTTLAEPAKEECLLTPGTVPACAQREARLLWFRSTLAESTCTGAAVEAAHQQSWEWRLPCC